MTAMDLYQTVSDLRRHEVTRLLAAYGVRPSLAMAEAIASCPNPAHRRRICLMVSSHGRRF